jgi:hypothetical protein
MFHEEYLRMNCLTAECMQRPGWFEMNLHHLNASLDIQCAKNHDGHCGYDCSLMFFRACSDLGPANAGYQHCKNSRMQSWSLAQEAISLGFIAIDPEGIACVAMAST